MTSIFSSNFNTINATSTFGGTLFNNLGSGSYGSTSGLFNGNTYGASGLFGSNFGYGGYGYFGNTFGSYFGSPWGSLGSIWGSTTTPVVTPTDTVTRTTGTTIATKQTDEEDNLSFVATDFAYLGGEVAASMQITDLPDHGTLEVDGHEVSLNETIGVDEFDNMDYIPDDDFDGTDTFSVKLSEDGATYDSSNSIIQINVLGENDAPDMNTLPTFSVAEGGTLDFFGDEIIAAFTDVDTGDYLSESVVEFESGEEFGELTYISDAGSTITIFHDEDVTLSANEISTLQFVAGADSVDDEGDTELVKLRLRPSDSEGEQTSGSHYLTIQVTDGDDAPTFDDDSVEYPIGENQLVVTDERDELYLAEDEESQNTLEYSISGLDADLFEVNNLNGEISFISAPDYEDPQDSNGDNSYHLDLTATDDAGQTATQTVVVNVVNEDPELALTVPTSAISVNEGETVVTTVSVDNDDISNEISFSLTGTDSEYFVIDETSGELTFKSAPDAENPGDTTTANTYDLTVVATDLTGESAAVSAAITVNVVDVADEDVEFVSAVTGSGISSPNYNVVSTDENSLEVEIVEGVTGTNVELLDLMFNNGEATTSNGLGNTAGLSFELDADGFASNFSLDISAATSGGEQSVTLQYSATSASAFDYEGDNEATLTLIATDQEGTTSEVDITISVTDKNEQPKYTAPDEEVVPVSVSGATETVNIGKAILGSMDDLEGDDLTFVVTGLGFTGLGDEPDLKYQWSDNSDLPLFYYDTDSDLALDEDQIQTLVVEAGTEAGIATISYEAYDNISTDPATTGTMEVWVYDLG